MSTHSPATPADKTTVLEDLLVVRAAFGRLFQDGLKLVVTIAAVFMVFYGPWLRRDAEPVDLYAILQSDMLARFLETMLFTAPVFVLCSVLFRVVQPSRPVLTVAQRLVKWLLIVFSLGFGSGFMTLGTTEHGWIEMPLAGFDNYGDSYEFMAFPYALALVTAIIVFLFEQDALRRQPMSSAVLVFSPSLPDMGLMGSGSDRNAADQLLDEDPPASCP